MKNKSIDLSGFCVVGISYKKTDAAYRSVFALPDERQRSFLEKSKDYGIDECFCVSTCNRTEIYVMMNAQIKLDYIFSILSNGKSELFHQLVYVKQGREALSHIFHVANGLDSQILGDYEVVGQIKLAVDIARKHGCIGTFMNRLLNTVFQASKRIKNQTCLSNGTVSVSYAAVQYIKEQVTDIGNKDIILIGTGKFGSTTCKHLVTYLDTNNITLFNRTPEKAIRLAEQLGVKAAPMSELACAIIDADIILVATNAGEPIIRKAHLQNSKCKTIIDLSIPFNVEPESGNLPNITLINVDRLSQITDLTIQMRQAEVPKATEIINTYIQEFLVWSDMRKHVPVLKAVKIKLKEIHKSSELVIIKNQHRDPDAHIQQVINTMASKMKSDTRPGCQYIEAINEFIS